MTVSAVLTTPTTTPVHLGTTTTYIDPRLWITLQDHANGKSGLPESLKVRFVGHLFDIQTLTESETLEADIGENGGTDAGGGWWNIPIGNVLAIVQRSDVWEAYYEAPSGTHVPRATTNTFGSIDDIITAYTGNITEVEAARYAMFVRGGSVLVVVQTTNAATTTEIRTWLSTRSVHVPSFSGTQLDDTELQALVPVRHLQSLSQAFTTTRFSSWPISTLHLTMDRTGWHANEVAFENSVTEPLVAGGTPSTSP